MQAMYFISLIIWGFILVLNRGRSKIVSLLCFAFMSIIFAFNTANNDYEAYLSFYNQVIPGKFIYINSNSNSSPLFTLTIMLAKILNLNFNAYRLALFIILFLILWLVMKNNARMEIYLFLYSWVLLFFDLVQLRFMTATIILLLAIIALIHQRKWLFVALIAMASLFHSIVIVFLPLVFIPNNWIKDDKAELLERISKIAVGFDFILIFASLLGVPILATLQNLASRISIFDEYGRYLNHTVGLGFILYLVYQIINLHFARKIYKDNCYDDMFEINKRIARYNYIIQSFGLFFVIFAMLDNNFSRFFRVFYLINALTFSYHVFALTNDREYVIEGKAILSRKTILNVCSCAFLIIAWVLGESLINKSYPLIKEMVFTSLKFF